MISVADQATGMMYRSYAATGFGGLNNTIVPNYTYRVAASYITGTHAFKTGWNDTFGYQEVIQLRVPADQLHLQQRDADRS